MYRGRRREKKKEWIVFVPDEAGRHDAKIGEIPYPLSFDNKCQAALTLLIEAASEQIAVEIVIDEGKPTITSITMPATRKSRSTSN